MRKERGTEGRKRREEGGGRGEGEEQVGWKEGLLRRLQSRKKLWWGNLSLLPRRRPNVGDRAQIYP